MSYAKTKLMNLEDGQTLLGAIDGKMSDLKSAFPAITGNEEITNWSENHLYIKTDGSTANINSPTTTSSNVRYAVVPASAGDIFTITATGGSGSRVYAFIANDGNGTILQKAPASSTYTGEVVTAPANTAYLVINDTSLTGSAFVGKLIKNQVAENNTRLDDKIHTLANEYIEKVYPEWESGDISSSTGEGTNSGVIIRTKGFISKADLALVTGAAHSGSFYVYRYNYSDGVYTFVGNSQRTGTGDWTSWFKGLTGTHFKLTWEGSIQSVYLWLTIAYTTKLKNINAIGDTVQNINIGTLTKNARELLISILRSAIFETDVSQSISKLNRFLIEPGELVILETGKRYAQTGSVSSADYSSITEYYPIETGAEKIVFFFAIDDLTQLENDFVIQRTSDGTLNKYDNMSNSGRQNAEYTIDVESLSETIGFTLNTASSQKSYAYFKNSGNIIFAGSLSQYAGYKNIKMKGVIA